MGTEQKTTALKKGDTVKYESPHGGIPKSGTGKIQEVRPTKRGLWYTVRDVGTMDTISLRAANLWLVRR